MKKAIFVVIFTFLSVFTFFPVRAQALTVSDGVLIAVRTPSTSGSNGINDLNSGYGQDQTCTGQDSLLGDPNDENSVAWLLDKILTYVTIIGMILVVVLSSLDFLKVIGKSDDESMAKAVKKLALRLLFGGLLFFVPTLTNAILDLFGLTSESTCGIHQ